MVDTTPQKIGRTLDARAPLTEFATIAIVLGVGLLWAADVLLETPIWALGAYGTCVWLVSRGLKRNYPHAVFGLCNAVTMLRAALLAFLGGILFDTQAVSPWIVFVVALLILVLDGFDGWLARRSELKSDFGARFDMETDAALGGVLALYLLIAGKTGAEVLVLGFARYVFAAVGLIWPVLRGALPDAFRRKAICVVQIAALIAMIFPPMSLAVIAPISLTASVLLVFSFAVDTIWLVRHKR